MALARAAWLNTTEGEIVSGGSTLTMQLARMARGNRARTYTQKLVEIMWSLRLEAATSKDEVLEMYAANAPFGSASANVRRTTVSLCEVNSATRWTATRRPSLIMPTRSHMRSTSGRL